MKDIITANGDYFLSVYDSSGIIQHDKSTIVISENSADATLIFGFADTDDNFVPYPNGVFNDGKLVNHGKGCRLMVSVSNIVAGSVTIRRFPG